MTRDIERILDRWFAEGPTEVADRVITGALDIIETTDQRRVSNAPRRYPRMNIAAKWAVAAALIAVLGGFSLIALQSRTSQIGAQPSSGPTSAVVATPSTTPLTSPARSILPSFRPSALVPASPSQRSPSVDGVIAIAAGTAHTCALTRAGAVMCWGSNTFGQLGDGTNSASATPVQVVGLASGVRTIAVGGDHGCALTTSGAVKCWGENTWGELGDGSKTASNTPVDVSSLGTTVVAIAAGADDTFAITTAGVVKAWGCDCSGQLGVTGSGASSATPMEVPSLGVDVIAISAGVGHTCALTRAGGAKCWGDNTFGQLGNGTQTGGPDPVNVTGLVSGVRAVALGARSNGACAITTSGAVKCWGTNGYGQLGNGATTDSSVAVDVAGLAGAATAISAGTEHTCALVGGGVSCWGWNLAGQLGDGTNSNSSRPIQVAGLESVVTAISAGDAHTCALMGGGTVACWGDNEAGQLGNGTTMNSSVPVAVVGF